MEEDTPSPWSHETETTTVHQAFALGASGSVSRVYYLRDDLEWRCLNGTSDRAMVKVAGDTFTLYFDCRRPRLNFPKNRKATSYLRQAQNLMIKKAPPKLQIEAVGAAYLVHDVPTTVYVIRIRGLSKADVETCSGHFLPQYSEEKDYFFGDSFDGKRREQYLFFAAVSQKLAMQMKLNLSGNVF